MKLFVLLLSCVFTVCCFRAIEPLDVVTPEVPSEPEQICAQPDESTKIIGPKQISLENVRFILDSDWIQEVEYSVIPECVLIRNDYKPDNIGGRTLQFNLRYSFSDDEARISVFKIADYKRAFGFYPQFLENRDAELMAIVNGPASLQRYGLDPPPHVVWMDAHHSFYSRAQRINFIGGRGILTLTNISHDSFTTIANSHLLFLFQGFTADGIYFVEMYIPVKLNGLPDEADDFPPRDSSRRYVYDSPKRVADWRKYLLRTASRIDHAPSADFQPAASIVEKFVRNFKIEQ